MILAERLQYHIEKIQTLREDTQVFYIQTAYRKEPTEIIKNPSTNELNQLLRKDWKDCGARGLLYKNDWYFWANLDALHYDVAKKLNLNYRDKAELIGNSVELNGKYGIAHSDYGDRIVELIQSMDSIQEIRSFLPIVMRALKNLQARYRLGMTNTEMKEFLMNIIKIWYDNSGLRSPSEYMTKQEYSAYRKRQYDKHNDWMKDSGLFDRF